MTTTIADLNNKWAVYAEPGGWNGKQSFQDLIDYAFNKTI